MKLKLYIATIVSLVTYLSWEFFKDEEVAKKFFFVGNALFIFLLCMIIYSQNQKLFISFFLFWGSLGNLLDELLFDPTKLGLNELALFIALPLIWLYKTKNDREIKPI